jgi:hypothetical protein
MARRYHYSVVILAEYLRRHFRSTYVRMYVHTDVGMYAHTYACDFLFQTVRVKNNRRLRICSLSYTFYMWTKTRKKMFCFNDKHFIIENNLLKFITLFFTRQNIVILESKMSVYNVQCSINRNCMPPINTVLQNGLPMLPQRPVFYSISLSPGVNMYGACSPLRSPPGLNTLWCLEEWRGEQRIFTPVKKYHF